MGTTRTNLESADSHLRKAIVELAATVTALEAAQSTAKSRLAQNDIGHYAAAAGRLEREVETFRRNKVVSLLAIFH